MNTSLSKEKLGEYIQVTYNTSIENLPLNLKYNATQFCLSEEDAEKFIKKVQELEVLISDYLKSNAMPYRTEFIILKFFPVIESISGGLDVRSRLSNEENAQRFCQWYHKKYQESLEFCNGVIAMYETEGKNESYMKHYRDYDKHNELVSEYELGLRKFGESDFAVNLAKILNGATRLLEELTNKENDKDQVD